MLNVTFETVCKVKNIYITTWQFFNQFLDISNKYPITIIQRKFNYKGNIQLILSINTGLQKRTKSALTTY